MASNDVTNNVKDYYGKKLQSSADLQTSACSNLAQKMPKYIRDVATLIHEDVVKRYYGCGLAIPSLLKNMEVLDLGSGSGRDCFVLSKLVGQEGFVTGVDMTDEQLELADAFVDYHTKKYGYDQHNVKFIKGFIERLDEAGIKDNSVDVLVSNCVINLCEDKRAVFREAYRVLKEGGELYFSDLYGNQKLPDELKSNAVLWGEGITGALHWKDFYDIAREIGFEIPRIVILDRHDIWGAELKKSVGDAKFASIVFRLFKLPRGADRLPSQVVYNGSIYGCETQLKFDRNYTFTKGESVTVDGDTSAILKASRYREAFSFSQAPGDSRYSKVVEEDPFRLLSVCAESTAKNATSCCRKAT